MRVKTTEFGPVRALVYRYSAGPDIDFEFYTLAEVGEPWQAEAKAEAQRTAAFWGKTIRYGMEIEHAPWIVDALV